MKEVGWEWRMSKKKTAMKIMWETQGQEFEVVWKLIAEQCDLPPVQARALYRNLSRDVMEAQGFVPAPIRLGRPRKDAAVASAGPAPHDPYPPPKAAVKAAVQPPEPEIVTEEERKSISDMKAYLEQLKRKVQMEL